MPHPPLVSIIIPTRNRPLMLDRAVSSALAQSFEDIEVIVVDDASNPSARPDSQDPRLRLMRLDENMGAVGARNYGLEAARGRFVTILDDDDIYLPIMVEKSLDAWNRTQLDAPVAVISALQVCDESGTVLETRIPPPLRRKGLHFNLEQQDPGCSYFSKHTLFVERDVLKVLGGWHRQPASRELTDLFLRLNPVCHIIGIPDICYRMTDHRHYRVSRDPSLRQENFQVLCEKHRDVFLSKKKGLAVLEMEHVENSLAEFQYLSAFKTLLKATGHAPWIAFRRTPGIAMRTVRRFLQGTDD